MTKPTKLELTWIDKENQPRLEPRILIEDPAKSYHALIRVSDKDLFDNRPIFGDNLLVLKALEQCRTRVLTAHTRGLIWFLKNGNARPRVKNYLSESEGVASWTWWTNELFTTRRPRKRPWRC